MKKIFLTLLLVFISMFGACAKSNYIEEPSKIKNTYIQKGYDVEEARTADDIASLMRLGDMTFSKVSKIILAWDERTDASYAVILFFEDTKSAKKALKKIESELEDIQNYFEGSSRKVDKSDFQCARQGEIVYFAFHDALDYLEK